MGESHGTSSSSGAGSSVAWPLAMAVPREPCHPHHRGGPCRRALLPLDRRVTGREVSACVFAGVNLAYEAAMVVLVRRALAREDAAWVVPVLGTITAANGIGHLAGSVVTRSYSPGVVSGVGVWAPLGLFAVARSRQLLPRPVWRRGIMTGALIL
jgi:hypothetical protein